jgi:cytochrome c oxidase assembly factor CtaG
MTTWQLLTTAWNWEPSVVSGCALLLGLYLGLARPLTTRALYFVAGVLVLLLSLVSPIDVLADTYLFSAHMLQHLLLMLVVPPLLLIGTPPQLVQRILAVAPIGRTVQVLTQPVLAWTIYHAFMWVWHVPALYDASLRHEGLHIAGHLLFLTTATIFWWPVIAPVTAAGRPLLAPWAAILYLVAAGVAGTVLGIILTFAPPGLYPSYLQPDDRLGILPLLRDGWGLSPAGDQQFGGMLMWIPGGLVYSFAVLAALARWFNEESNEHSPLPTGESRERGTMSTECEVDRPSSLLIVQPSTLTKED